MNDSIYWFRFVLAIVIGGLAASNPPPPPPPTPPTPLLTPPPPPPPTTQPPPTVTLNGGEILEGMRVQAQNDDRAVANVFLGIRYAEPPLGKLRFQASRPLAAASRQPGVRIRTTEYKPACWQNRTGAPHPVTFIDEDCLYVNVFADVRCQSGNGTAGQCPVLYYIHGGAFEFDSPIMFPVEGLVDRYAGRGLVLVTVSYRLGLFGFWTLGSSAAPANNAISDAVQGLRWIKHEIRNFGGDPGRVTIMGHSSGASFVSLLTLSPRTDGMFNRAIMLSPALEFHDRGLDEYRRLAETVGCADSVDWRNHDSDHRIITCMQNMPADLIGHAFHEYQDTLVPGTILAYPKVDGPGGWFPEDFAILAENRRPVDSILGTTKNENGPSKVKRQNATAVTVADLCAEKVQQLAVNNREILVNECQRRYVLEPIASHRTVSDSPFSFWTEQLVEISEDIAYFAPTFREAAQLVDSSSTVYLYSFDYEKRGQEGITPYHAFDLTYILGVHMFPYDERDVQIQSTYISLFRNYVLYGDPTPPAFRAEFNLPQWTPMKSPPIDMSYYSIDVPETRMRDKYHYNGVMFWSYILRSFNKSETLPTYPLMMMSRDLFGDSPEEMSMLGRSYLNGAIDPIDRNNSHIDDDDDDDDDRNQFTMKTVQIDDQSNGIDWKLAFWITLGGCVLLVTATVLVHVHVCRTQRRRRRYRQQALEEESSLLSSMKRSESYSTFY